MRVEAPEATRLWAMLSLAAQREACELIPELAADLNKAGPVQYRS